MVFLGASDTVQAAEDIRGVCDLYSNHYVAWVINGLENIETAPVMRAARTTSTDGRQPLIVVAIRIPMMSRISRYGCMAQLRPNAWNVGTAMMGIKGTTAAAAAAGICTDPTLPWSPERSRSATDFEP